MTVRKSSLGILGAAFAACLVERYRLEREPLVFLDGEPYRQP